MKQLADYNITREMLYDEYIVKKKSMRDLSKIFKCRYDIIQHFMGKYKIKKENRCGRNHKDGNLVPLDYDWIYNQYVTLGKTMNQIRKENNCSREVIRYRLDLHKISSREDHGGLGNRNCNWKGENVSNVNLHKWVRKHLPRPKLCENCNVNEATCVHSIGHTYERDLTKWLWVCFDCNFHKLIGDFA